MTKEQLIGEIAFLLGDPYFKDFTKEFYHKAFYRAKREVAKKYSIYNKIAELELENWKEWENKPEKFPEHRLLIPDFKDEYYVSINDIVYEKASYRELNPERFEYSLKTNITAENPSYNILFDYTGDRERIDRVLIKYIALPDYEGETFGEFDLPAKYEEKVVKETILYLCYVGLANYNGSALGQKYEKLLSLYFGDNAKNEYDKRLKNEEWIKIRPYSVI